MVDVSRLSLPAMDPSTEQPWAGRGNPRSAPRATLPSSHLTHITHITDINRTRITHINLITSHRKGSGDGFGPRNFDLQVPGATIYGTVPEESFHIAPAPDSLEESQNFKPSPATLSSRHRGNRSLTIMTRPQPSALMPGQAVLYVLYYSTCAPGLAR